MVSKIINSFNEITKIDNDFLKIIEKFGVPLYKKQKNNFTTLMKIIVANKFRKIRQKVFIKS